MNRFFTSLTLAFALSVGACGPLVPHPEGPSAEAVHTAGQLDVVESVPLETNLDHPDIPDAYEVWPAMIAGATRTLDLAEFYVSDAPRSRLAPVVDAIEAAARRGVVVRLLVDAGFAKKYPESLDRLAAVPGIAVRRFDVGRVMGGVLHAKYFVVDGRETYLGSQNLDWRSLTHIHEIGVRLRDPAATATYARVFELDWCRAWENPGPYGRTVVLPPECPQEPSNTPLSFVETAFGKPVQLTPVASPRGFLPDARTWELPRIVALLDGAKRSVRVQVLTYDTVNRDKTPFKDLDDALRRAAARGVEVSLLVSDWSKRRGPREAVQALARVPGIKVKFIDVPPWSGGFVPFARVAHAKYLVVDGARAWVGTSNWEGDYFTRSRNVGLIAEGEAFAAGLERVFHDAFEGPYAEVVDPDKTYEAPRIAGPDGK